MSRSHALVLLLVAGAFGCGGDASLGPSRGFGCIAPAQVGFVRDTLRDIYFWSAHLPDPDVTRFTAPEAYLDAVRFRPLDASFSYIADKEESDAFFSSSQFIGIGFSNRQTGPAELRVGQVFPDSPASEAGLARGDFLLEVNGRPVPQLLASGELAGAFGPNQVGVAVRLTWRSRGGAVSTTTVVKRLVTIPTVSATRVYELDGRRVGYVHFRNFVTPSTPALDTAFAALQASGVSDLVLDLRYNGGGLLSVAQHLGGLVGGTPTRDRTFVEFVHNAQNSSRNRTLFFPHPPGALGLPRLVVIATRSSASASEVVVNSLRPFLPVTLVGDATFGKPVGQYGFDFCDKTLFPVSFQLRNARGEGDYFGGIPADCPAADDLDHELGAPEEASLAEAFHFLRTGRCSRQAPEAAAAHAQRERRIGRGVPADGWRLLVDAH